MVLHVGARAPGHLARVAGGDFDIAKLFAGGDGGFDFTDLDFAKAWPVGADTMTLLVRDTVGGAVTGSGQQVGQLFDKSQGFALGPELLTNGSFTGQSPWVGDMPHWSVAGGVATHGAGASIAEDIRQTMTAAAGDAFLCRAEMVAGVAGGTINLQSPFNDSANGVAPPNGSAYVARGIATVANEFRLRASTGFLKDIDNASCRKIAGNHALQGTSSARPLLQVNSGKPYLAFDGSDDCLECTFVPGASMTLAVCGRASTANTIFFGSNAAANTRSYLTLNTAGQFGGGVGAQNADTIGGGADLRGADFVGLVRYNGTTVEAWVNGVRVYQGAQSGAPNTTQTYAMGCLANGGARVNFINGRIYGAVAVQSYIADADVPPLMRRLGALAGLTF